MDPAVSAFAWQFKQGVKFLPTNLLAIFPELIVISFQQCGVILVGNHFKGFFELQYLDLAYNNIRQISNDAFDDLTILESLNLSHNRIQYFGEKTFASMKKLTTMYLNNNKIQALHPKTFNSLMNVEAITIYENRISALPESIFENAVNLKRIHLSKNKLERLPAHLFKNNLKLEKIELNANNINFVDASMFDHLQSLESVAFESNACIDASYEKNNFETMRTNLRQNCNGNSTMITTVAAVTESSGVTGLSSSGKLISLSRFTFN